MRIILFGATGMVGQGVLRECLLDADVQSVLTIGRGAAGQRHEKLREIVRKDLADLAPIETELAGYDASFFCLGVSSAGMTEADYRAVTYSLTMAVARTLARLNSGMTFIYVSGVGTDSSGKGASCGRASRARPKTICFGHHSMPPTCSTLVSCSRCMESDRGRRFTGCSTPGWDR